MTDDEHVYADMDALRVVVPAAIGLVVLGLVGLIGFVVFGGDPELTSSPVGAGGEEDTTAPADPVSRADLVLQDFVVRLADGRLDGLTFAFDDAAEAVTDLATLTAELGPHTIEPVTGTLALLDDSNATAPLRVTWTLDDGTVFETEGEVDLVLVGTEWLVDWAPSVLETSLDPGDVLVRERVVPPRAPILGAGDVPLVDDLPVWEVGVVPRNSDDIAGLSVALGGLLQIEPAEIQAAIAPSPSDSVVPIATRRVEELSPIEAQLLAIPGVVLEPATYPLAPDEVFARALLGRAGEVTAEILDEHPDLFLVGDVVGRSGLQRQYNERLAGVPGFQVRVDRRFPTPASPITTTTAPDPSGGGAGAADGDGAAAGAGAASGDPSAGLAADESGIETVTSDGADDPDVLYLDAPVPGEALRLTIDPRVQRAAEEALQRTERTSALVAIQPSTGHVLAVANGPGAAVQDFALVGQYPPGSIFKIVTVSAALAKGVGPQDEVDCPDTKEVNGRVFRNAEGERPGNLRVRRAFVQSCNTAFINLAQAALDAADFPSYAARFGIGVGYDLGTPAYSGSVPTPGGPVDFAATSFGQGQTLVSPLSAAVMAATAADGSYRPPVLVVDPEATPAPAQPLDAGVVGPLRDMMRAVVTNGTGREVSNVAGGPVSGKTGTAEFGGESPPRTHAWFVGFQGDLAFAVFVEDGGFGGQAAAPIAALFLNRLSG